MPNHRPRPGLSLAPVLLGALLAVGVIIYGLAITGAWCLATGWPTVEELR